MRRRSSMMLMYVSSKRKYSLQRRLLCLLMRMALWRNATLNDTNREYFAQTGNRHEPFPNSTRESRSPQHVDGTAGFYAKHASNRLPGINHIQTLRVARGLTVLDILQPHVEVTLVLSYQSLKDVEDAISDAVVANQGLFDA